MAVNICLRIARALRQYLFHSQVQVIIVGQAPARPVQTRLSLAGSPDRSFKASGAGPHKLPAHQRPSLLNPDHDTQQVICMVHPHHTVWLGQPHCTHVIRRHSPPPAAQYLSGRSARPLPQHTRLSLLPEHLTISFHHSIPRCIDGSSSA